MFEWDNVECKNGIVLRVEVHARCRLLTMHRLIEAQTIQEHGASVQYVGAWFLANVKKPKLR